MHDHDAITERAMIVGSVIFGLFAWDAYKHRANLARFAKFVGAFNRPAATAQDRTYNEAVNDAASRR